MPERDIVALVTPTGSRGHGLRDHLRQLGFSVRELHGLSQASIYSRVVLHLDRAPDAEMRAAIEAYLAGDGRLVVITPTLPAMREVTPSASGQMLLLIPPVFPWQLRDALLGRSEALP